MIDTADPGAERPARPWLWGGLFILNMGLISVASAAGLIERPIPGILLALNMVLLIPMVHQAYRRQEQKGAMSPALRRYNFRAIAAMAAYMVAMIAAGNFRQELAPGSRGLWLLALIPVPPLFAMIWTMVRYYREEQDEFLRHRAVVGALIGLVLVLLFGTVWGFLEMFGLVPHLHAWWVFPGWAVGLAIGMGFNTRMGEK